MLIAQAGEFSFGPADFFDNFLCTTHASTHTEASTWEVVEVFIEYILIAQYIRSLSPLKTHDHCEIVQPVRFTNSREIHQKDTGVVT